MLFHKTDLDFCRSGISARHYKMLWVIEVYTQDVGRQTGMSALLKPKLCSVKEH